MVFECTACSIRTRALHPLRFVLTSRNPGPVSELTDAINALVAMSDFKIKDFPMPADATNCLHSALNMIRALGVDVPSYEEYSSSKNYGKKDAQKAWVDANPGLAAQIGLIVPPS